MNKNIKDLDKYTETGGSIKIKKEASELNSWYDLEEILHEAHKQSRGDKNQWQKLTGRGRTFDCFIKEIETTIKSLGGKLFIHRERERERETFAIFVRNLLIV